MYDWLSGSDTPWHSNRASIKTTKIDAGVTSIGAYAEDYAEENDIPYEFLGLRGDTNGDGLIDLKDVTMLRRHLAGGYNVTVVEDSLDVNGDGTVDLKDVTYLRRGLAGGYGIELSGQ